MKAKPAPPPAPGVAALQEAGVQPSGILQSGDNVFVLSVDERGRLSAYYGIATTWDEWEAFDPDHNEEHKKIWEALGKRLRPTIKRRLP